MVAAKQQAYYAVEIKTESGWSEYKRFRPTIKGLSAAKRLMVALSKEGYKVRIKGVGIFI